MLQGTHQSRRGPYWPCSIRVSALIAARIERIAIREHWEVSDLARMLICLGASGSFLRLGDPEASERFKALAKTGRTLNALDAALGKASHSLHASPGIGIRADRTTPTPGLGRNHHCICQNKAQLKKRYADDVSATRPHHLSESREHSAGNNPLSEHRTPLVQRKPESQK